MLLASLLSLIQVRVLHPGIVRYYAYAQLTACSCCHNGSPIWVGGNPNYTKSILCHSTPHAVWR